MTVAAAPLEAPHDAPHARARRGASQFSAWVVAAALIGAVGWPLARWVGLGPVSGPWAYWPVQGAICGILFKRAYREWPAIALAAIVAQTVTIYVLRGDLAGGATVVGAAGGVAQAALGAWLVRRLQRGASPLERSVDLAWFVLVAVTIVPLAITPLVALAYARGLHLSYANAWWPLFVGNSLSVLLFAPPFMCWRERVHEEEPWRARPPEVALCMLTILALAALVFGGPESWLRYVALPYSMFLALAWAATRCGVAWTAVAIVVLATVSAWCSARGLGPFGSAATLRQEGVLALQAYLAFAALAALLLASLTEQRRRAFATVALQNAVQEAFFSSSTSLMLLKDVDGRYLIVNPAAAEAFGTSVPEMTGRLPRDVIEAGSAAMIAQHDRRVLERGEAITFDETLHIGAVSRRLLVTRFPVRDHTGVIRYLGVVARDETLERELSERLHRAQSVEMLGQLAAGVAHDLNNLLTVLVSNTQLLGEMSERSEEEHSVLRDTRQAALQAARLTERLMTLGRRRTDQASAVGIDETLRDLEPLLRALVRGNVDLLLELHAPEARVVADPTALEQIVLNLVSNARAAIRDDGRIVVTSAIVVETADRAAGPSTRRAVRLSVADTGTGMNAETLARIFEPFFTTKTDTGGTGLGLYTVSILVRQMGGTISASSVPGGDTTFVIDLPIQSD